MTKPIEWPKASADEPWKISRRFLALTLNYSDVSVSLYQTEAILLAAARVMETWEGKS